MKHIKTIFLAFGLAASLQATAQTYTNPDYECRAVTNLIPTKVEQTKDATRISFHVKFRPKWWISIDSTAYIINQAHDIKLAPVAAEGLTLGEKFWMPDSGETDFTVIYPPVPKEVDNVNFIDGRWKYFGLRLDGKKAPKPLPVDVDSLMSAAHRDYPGEPTEFLAPGEATVSGRIVGLDKRLGFESLLLYVGNSVTGEDIPRNIEIADDGTFSVKVPLASPSYVNLTGLSVGLWQYLYLEPGRTLDIFLTVDDILDYDEKLRVGKQPKLNIGFGGELGDVNRQLVDAPDFKRPDEVIYEGGTDPDIALARCMECRDANAAAIAAYMASKPLLPVTIRILDASVKANCLSAFLEYTMSARQCGHDSDSFASKERKTIELRHYDCLREILAEDDEWIMATPDWRVIPNRVAFDVINKLVGASEKYGFDNLCDDVIYNSRLKTEAYTRFAGRDTAPRLWQCLLASRLVGCRFLPVELSRQEDVNATLDSLEASGTISHPQIMTQLRGFYDKAYAMQTWELPDDERGNLMRSLIEPHKGKMLVIDFWATTCGPCRYNIEATAEKRARNRENPDFKYIFITSVSDSPRNSYDAYVAKNLEGETSLFLTGTEFNRLRDLFGFSGIPHYVLIDREGKVVNGDFSIHDMASQLEPHGVTVF